MSYHCWLDFVSWCAFHQLHQDNSKNSIFFQIPQQFLFSLCYFCVYFWANSSTPHDKHCLKSVRIGVILVSIFPYSVQMRENTDQNNSEYGFILRSERLFQISNVLSATMLLIVDNPIRYSLWWIYCFLM